jgi:hypothetical protein
MVFLAEAIWMTSTSPGTEDPVTPTTTVLHIRLESSMHIAAADSPTLSAMVRYKRPVTISMALAAPAESAGKIPIPPKPKT